MTTSTKTPFQIEREAADRALLARYSIRNRADIDKAAPAGDTDPTSPAFLLRDSLFCAACRVFGSDVCDGCGRLTIAHDLTNHGSLALCEKCQERVDDEGVRPLPDWVKDRDLPDILPALVRAFVRSAREKSGGVR